MKVLRARLYDMERGKRSARSRSAQGQVGSGNRSEKIRTYNFPQGRMTDHRINLTLRRLPEILEGAVLGELINALITEGRRAELAAALGE